MDLKVSYPVRNPPQPPALSAPQWALLIGARCHAQGCGDNEAEAHAALVSEARELHAALGPWLGGHTHTNPEHDPFHDEYAHEVDVSTRMRFARGKPFAQVVATLEDTGVSEGVCGMGATREAALESLRAALVTRQASEWAAFARALKGGE
jgi:hypothetical protein